MPSKRASRAAPRANTKEKILEAAVELFSERGYHESSMRDIAARVGIEAPSLYAHFDSKEAILQAILDAHRSEVVKMRVPDAELEELTQRHTTEEFFVGGFKAIVRGVSAPGMLRISRLLLNEMVKNPLVGAFELDTTRPAKLRELTRTFSALHRRGKLRPVDPTLVAVVYNALVNAYFQERFVLETCGRDTRALEEKTLKLLAKVAAVFAAEPPKEPPDGG